MFDLQVLRYWPFGFTWCRIWLAIDVWLCTSSILNLCAISLDRFLAISRPFRYLSIMSSRRARLLVVSVWILAFIICFPPLVSWNEKHFIAGVANGGGGGLTASGFDDDNATETSSNGELRLMSGFCVGKAEIQRTVVASSIRGFCLDHYISYG